MLPPPPTDAQLSAPLLGWVNAERDRNVVPPLRTWSLGVCNAARHSLATEQAGNWFLMDLRPIQQTMCGSYVSQVVAKTWASASDIATAADVVRVWMQNPHTRALLLYANLTHGGCSGAVKDSYVYSTCVFLSW